MRVSLGCPKCGASMTANLPDTVLPVPAGWLVHQQVTCGRCGHVLQFEDGGAPAAVDAITAWVFTLTNSRSGALVGAAVVCLEARYVSLKVHGQPRIERRPPAQWRPIRDALAALQDGAIVDRGSALGALLSRDLGEAVTVTAVRRERLDVRPLATATSLDALLVGAAEGAS